MYFRQIHFLPKINFSLKGIALMSHFIRTIICLLTVVSLCFMLSAEVFAELGLSAASAVLIDASSGRIIYEKDANSRRPMASTTKIMTALVALESGNTDRTVTVPAEACGVEGSSIYLAAGDKVTLKDLIWAVMLESANDAATAVAIEVGGSVEGFADMMNSRAAELGLSGTHFTNPHGLDDEEHYTTASDLAKLAATALENEQFREIASTYRHTITVGEKSRYLLNHNKMLKLYEGSIGVKTGYTKHCGRCLVSSAERDGVRLVAVTLNAPDDWRDHAAMLDYGFSTLESRLILAPGESTFILPCIGGEKNEIRIKNRDAFTVCLPKESEVNATVELPKYFWAEVNEGDEVGRIIFNCDGQYLGEVALYADETVARVRYKQSIFDKVFG